MITIRPGSHIHRLLLLLSVGGEFPSSSIGILGKVRVYKALVHSLESIQSVRAHRDGQVYTTKLMTVSGKRAKRTIRLYRGALPILNAIHPNALEYYLNAFQEHKFTGDAFHIWRNHRVSEALAICLSAGLEMRPYALPELQLDEFRRTVPGFPSFYIARDFKKLDVEEFNKTMYTRIVGAVFYPGGVYAVYNTRGAVMKWSGIGEFKAKMHLEGLSSMNAGIQEVSSALLLGKDAGIAMQTLLESDKTRKKEMRFDKIYQRIHFIPLNQDGARLLRILVLPDWQEKILGQLFLPDMRPRGYGRMEYDAYIEGTYIYSHLDSDIARLIRFREALISQTDKFEVLCFPWQAGFLKEYLGPRAILKQLGMEKLEKALGILR